MGDVLWFLGFGALFMTSGCWLGFRLANTWRTLQGGVSAVDRDAGVADEAARCEDNATEILL